MTVEQGYILSIGDLSGVIPMAFPDASVRSSLEARLKDADVGGIAVRILPVEPADVEGHALSGALQSVQVNVQLDDDDVEGHSISVHFPSASEADLFRKRLLATGLLAGAIVLGSVGAVAIANQPASVGATAPAQTLYQPPVGHGLVEGADMGALGAAADSAISTAISGSSAVDPATGRPARSGLQAGTDIGMGIAADSDGGAPATGHNWVAGADK